MVNKSDKSYLITVLLSAFLGGFGLHRFYVGKIGTGFLMLFTAGGFFVWAVIDLLWVLSGHFKDKQGLRIKP